MNQGSAARGAWPAFPASPLMSTEYKASYARNRSIRSVAVRGYHISPDDTSRPRNLTKRHWPGAPEDQDDRDGGDFSGTGGLPDYSTNPIKVTHR